MGFFQKLKAEKKTMFFVSLVCKLVNSLTESLVYQQIFYRIQLLLVTSFVHTFSVFLWQLHFDLGEQLSNFLKIWATGWVDRAAGVDAIS